MPFCSLQLDKTRTKVTCKVCGEPFPVTVAELIAFEYDLTKFDQVCGSIFDESQAIAPEPPKRPPLWRRAWNFTRAWAIQLWHGNPRVSDKIVKKRLAACEACPLGLYHAGYCTHEACGCPIKDRDTYFSKLYWKTGKCPGDLW